MDSSPEAAIAQIKERNYMARFTGNMPPQKSRAKRILLVGIGYDRTGKKHSCKMETVDIDGTS